MLLFREWKVWGMETKSAATIGKSPNKSDDPAFLYFPTNYRWSMGLLICLSGAPWMGTEIDEVNRVGRALAGKVGDDDAWFTEWVRMGDKIEARGRDELRKGHKLTAASCFMRATRYYQTGERFIQPRSQTSMDVYAKSVRIFQEAAALMHRPRIEPVEIPYGSTTLPGLLVHPDPEVAGKNPAQNQHLAWCSSTDSTSPRRSNTAMAFQTWPRAASAA